jgi:Xaa-Pro aminopeptidase
MEVAEERMTTSISTAELERRWQAMREMMARRQIDYLLARNDEEFLGGYVRWFTDLPARHNYPFTVIFPAEDEMTLISCGPAAPAAPAPPPWAVRGVKRRLSAPYFPSAHYTGTYDAELAVGVLREKADATVGLVGPAHIPMNFFAHLQAHLPGATFVDATDDVDRLKAIKSPEERALIRETAAMQDRALAHVQGMIRPGLREYEIYAEILHFTSLQGSERQLILVGSGPQGTPVPFAPRRFQNRVIQDGDQVSLLIEVNGPGGYYAELGRIFSLGEPCQALQGAFTAACEAQQLSLEQIRPGADPGAIAAENSAFLERRGYLPERRLYAHGQGYDLVERPLIRDDEPMPLQADMNLTVHPTATGDQVWAGVVDNYFVTADGVSPCLHATPKEIIVL